MKHQRINTSTAPPMRVAAPSDPRVGRRTIWDDELHGPVPELAAPEKFVPIEPLPEPLPDHRVVPVLTAERDGWQQVPLTVEEIAAQNRPQPVTKLTLMTRLVALGKWETFKAVLSQAPEIVQDAWTLAQDIRADDPIFVANRDGFRTALDLTVEEFDALLTPSGP